MYDDYDQREANIASFLSNKIKRCIKFGRELDNKEKFYYTDRICNPCRGLQPFESEDVPELESESKSPFPIINLDLSKYEDKGQQNRSDFEKQVFSHYPEWQLLREKAEKDWNVVHPRPVDITFINEISNYNLIITDERIAELINQYDENSTVNIKVEELISLLWEIREYRGI
ncbi:hypothetical protein PQM54_004567 [Klebsiella pneumoniae]|uniref:hypothetical protein n=1 Tax=Klebsiella pneumoniae complex TaxID=3390273 RepID=UPI002B053FB3|nr:hypothetical protein [Klebsiella quasipneumoniae]EKL1160129.1 hypothetical protein [Klebsiella pneumoniae]HBR6331703.1 hypothetical protein [Klebsiella pneumoniae]HBR7863527.1 hypothetical protein [Klebsiella pneumoniae]HBW1054173.1 hypothetical protein [Klebsiella pneumoniae]